MGRYVNIQESERPHDKFLVPTDLYLFSNTQTRFLFLGAVVVSVATAWDSDFRFHRIPFLFACGDRVAGSLDYIFIIAYFVLFVKGVL